MNIITSQTNSLTGTVTIPGSKSQTIRGLILATLAKGKSVLKNALASDDSEAAIRVCRALGARVAINKDQIIIESGGIPLRLKSLKLNSGDSGITTRFIMPALGLRQNHHQRITLDCGRQMKARPIKSLINALRDLGMKINGNRLPIKISGRLIGGKTMVDGLTSQYLSALLLNLPCAQKDSEISVKNLHERPYVEMTLALLKEQGIRFENTKRGKIDKFKIKGGQIYHAFQKTIPGDFSSASYFLAAGAMLGHNLTIKGLDIKDPQADKELINILKKMGAGIKITGRGIVLNQSNLRGVKIDAKDIPDLLPAIAVLGTKAVGKTEILNVPQARVKETDRIHSMSEGLRKMGAKIKELKDGLIVYKSDLQAAKVRGYNDHRTVMALSLAGMLANGKMTIDSAQSINKTFPEFIQLMQNLGANITLK